MLQLQVVLNQYQARLQKLKSLTNRISRAKRNVPSAGSLPYGRTFDRKTETWGIDPEKKAIIEQAASRYLAGEALPKIAASFGMNAPNLWKIL